MTTGANSLFDLKVGYACNNKCIHCVVETNRLTAIEKGSEKLNLSFGDIMRLTKENEFKNSRHVTITGGEPTLRKDFMRIIKHISDTYPDKYIGLQTNGRLLGKYLEEISKLTNNIFYIIAVHSSDEALHNKIVGTNEKDNPYKETMESLEELKRVYGDFKTRARIEIVLSSLNYKSIPKTIKDLYEMGFNYIGLSYPHLDGFHHKYGSEKVREIGLSYEQLREVLPDIQRLALANEDLKLAFEEVPTCMWRDENGRILQLPKNIESMSERTEEVAIKYPDQETKNFLQSWVQMHKKSTKCKECVLGKCCIGVWYEAIDAHGDKGFTPITEEEIGGLNKCSY